MAPADEKRTVSVRIPQTLINQVRTIAECDSESHSTVIRRLLRRALEIERLPAPPAPVPR